MKRLASLLACTAALQLPSCLDDVTQHREDFAEQAQMANESVIKGWILTGTRNIRQTLIRDWQEVDVYIRYDMPPSANLREELLALFRAPQPKERYNFSRVASHRVSSPGDLWMAKAVLPRHKDCPELDFWTFAPDSAGEELELSHAERPCRMRIFIDETQQQVYMHLSL